MKTTAYQQYTTKQNQLTRYAPTITIATAIILILLFTSTGLGKITNHVVFSIQLAKQPLPSWSKPILLYVLPTLEVTTILLLCFSAVRKYGFLLASILMISYTLYAYLAYTEVYGYVICACGKIFQSMNWRDHFLANAVLALIALTGLYFSIRAMKLSGYNHNNETNNTKFKRTIQQQ